MDHHHFDPLTLHDTMSKQQPHDNTNLLTEPHLTQAQAASMRRKKNADAQAAFRARRANYIASLEETVTSLEAVVLSLQDTCRDSRTDAEDARHENIKLLAQVDALKQANRAREKEWRDFWHEKLQALGLDVHDYPPPPPRTPPVAADPPRPFVDDALRFPYALHPAGGKAAAAAGGDPRFAGALQPFTANPEGSWIAGPFSNTRTPCVGEHAAPHPSQSSEASDSPPSLSPGMAFSTHNSNSNSHAGGSARFPGGPSLGGAGEEHGRMSLVSISMPYGRTSSPSGSTPSLVSDGLYLAEPGALGPHDYGAEAAAAATAYHHPHGERYRPRRAHSGPQGRGELYAGEGALARAGSPLQLEMGEGQGQQGRPRRHTSASLMGAGAGHSPGSPPPTPPSRREEDRDAPMSNTLAVIKAQAFGSLRRTRTRAKKPSDSASKVAIDILAARGIGMGVQVAAPGAGGHGVGAAQRKVRKGEDDVDMA